MESPRAGAATGHTILNQAGRRLLLLLFMIQSFNCESFNFDGAAKAQAQYQYASKLRIGVILRQMNPAYAGSKEEQIIYLQEVQRKSIGNWRWSPFTRARISPLSAAVWERRRSSVLWFHVAI
jgi:hypothetical protein